MKRIIIIALACAPVFWSTSCASVDKGPKYPNMVADMDPFSVGTITAQFERLLSSQLSTNDVEVFFYPRQNAVVLEFRHEFITYRQFWDQQGRVQYAQALEQYKADYTARNLSTRTNRTKAAYGKVDGWIEWQAFKYTANRRAAPIIELGYRFRGDMPFFLTGQRSAREEPTESEEGRQESVLINMYYTRAQADELVRLFDQSLLMELMGEQRNPRSAEQPTDSYREYDDQLTTPVPPPPNSLESAP